MKTFQKIEFCIVLFMLILNLVFIFSFSHFNFLGFSIFENKNLVSSNHIQEDKIVKTDEGILIKLDEPVLSKYSNSESMVPLLDSFANGIGFKPQSEKDIEIGDVISFYEANNLIVHRVVEKGEDEFGIYFITKGDNNFLKDGKIRFENIDSVLVGVIY